MRDPTRREGELPLRDVSVGTSFRLQARKFGLALLLAPVGGIPPYYSIGILRLHLLGLALQVMAFVCWCSCCPSALGALDALSWTIVSPVVLHLLPPVRSVVGLPPVRVPFARV